MQPRKFNTQDGFRYKVTVSVRPYKRVTRSFPSITEAREWAEDHARELKQHRRAIRSVDLTQLTLGAMVDRFLADPEIQALKYYEELKDYLAWWVNWNGGVRVLRTGALLWREGRDKLRTEMRGRQRADRRAPKNKTPLSPATVNRYLSAMRACWNWARAAELIPSNMVWPSRLMLTEPTGRTRHLSDAELDSLLKAAAENSATMHAAILTSIACGLRQGELLRLRWSDVDFDKSRLRILLTKNGEARAVYLPATAAAALAARKKAPVVGHSVFSDEAGQPVDRYWIEYRWRSIRTAAGLEDFRWHDLRHSCASFLAQQGANLLEIGSVLGHKSPSVTKRYAHLVEGSPVTGHAKLDEKLKGR